MLIPPFDESFTHSSPFSMQRLLACQSNLVMPHDSFRWTQANAFAYTPSQTVMLRQGSASISGLKRSSFAVSKPVRATALKMQSEDDKAKAAGIALAVVGLIASKFSILVAVLAGGAGVYCGMLEPCTNLPSPNVIGLQLSCPRRATRDSATLPSRFLFSSELMPSRPSTSSSRRMRRRVSARSSLSRSRELLMRLRTTSSSKLDPTWL
eukprot:266236-Hanusia_phi.AAC.2